MVTLAIPFFSDFQSEQQRKLKTFYEDCQTEDEQLFLESLKELNLSPLEMTVLRAAIELGSSQVYGTRDIDRYYFSHPLRVARYLVLWMRSKGLHDFEPIVVALLHAVLEKKLMTADELRAQFGAKIVEGVRALTGVGSADKLYQQIAAAGSATVAIKCFDKIDNLFALCLNKDAQVRRDYLAEIEIFLVPLADSVDTRLGETLRQLVAANRLS